MRTGRFLLYYFPAKGVLGLESYDENHVVWLADVVPQMVEDSSSLTHARRGNDDHGTVLVVQGLRVFFVADHFQIIEIKKDLHGCRTSSAFLHRNIPDAAGRSL